MSWLFIFKGVLMKVQYFEGGMYKHMCPACGYLHYIPVHYPFSNGNQWFLMVTWKNRHLIPS